VHRRLVILGPPGGGKGTHAGRLGKELGVPHISTGDMLRREVSEGADLGRQAGSYLDSGRLVPDELVIKMTVERLSRSDAKGGWILDGFPRNLGQARALESRLEDGGVELVLVLEVTDDDVFERISGRRTCPRGHVYHVVSNPPKREGVCDEDGLPLRQREDAATDVIERRLEIYKAETGPLLDFYEQRSLVRRIDGTGRPDDVYPKLLSAVTSR
jgi:adenylate kinase